MNYGEFINTVVSFQTFKLSVENFNDGFKKIHLFACVLFLSFKMLGANCPKDTAIFSNFLFDTHTHSVVFSPFATFPFFLIFIHSSTTGLSIFSLFCLVCFRCAPTTLPPERLFSSSSSHPLRLVFAHKKKHRFPLTYPRQGTPPVSRNVGAVGV